MKIFDEKHIKNIVLVGAHNSGKTTLSETMLFEAGLLKRRGTVEDKNTVSDYNPIEQEREASIYATPMHTEWRNYKINIIDTPGLDDFIGEIISSIRVSDTVVTVINGRQGVEVGTEIIWNYIDKYNRPTLFVVNQIDHPETNFDDNFKSITSLVGNNAVQIQFPVVIDGAQCIIDVLKMKMYKFGKEGGKPEKLAIPENFADLANSLHNELVEKAAENDEELLELFFEKGRLTKTK
jgi:elongation factor G